MTKTDCFEAGREFVTRIHCFERRRRVTKYIVLKGERARDKNTSFSMEEKACEKKKCFEGGTVRVTKCIGIILAGGAAKGA